MRQGYMNAFDEVNQFFDRAADRLGLDDGTRELLKKPWRELTVSVPVRMDDGSESRSSTATAFNTTLLAGPTRGERAFIPLPMSTRCGRSRPS